ncbi:MAG: CRTAC1 family protein [Acidobacteriota bacterium]
MRVRQSLRALEILGPSLLGSLLLSSLHLLATPLAAQDWFQDVTKEAGLDFVHFNGMSGRLYYLEVVGSGGALFDFDNDGDLDLYLVQSAMLGADLKPTDATFPWRDASPPQDRLYRNELVPAGELRFVDVTASSGIRAEGYGIGAATGDFDNDGWTDLYLPQYGRNQLWRNRGDGTFEDVTRSAGVGSERWSTAASWTDFDADGHLDLYVVNYLEYNLITHKTCLTERGEPDYCLPNAYQPALDALYRNRGDGTFEDVSGRLGLKVASNGLGVVGADLDGNGRLDFYVANDLLDNQLWLQQPDGRFVDDGLLAGVAVNREGKPEASMGVAAGDADNDGDLDLFMTHFRRETNTLYRAQGDGFFDDDTQKIGLGNPSWEFTSFGTGFFDFDNDGWLDLVTANGAVTYPAGADRDRNAFPLDEPNQLFRGGSAGYEEVTERAGAGFAASHVSRGALLGDVDNDGDTDLVFTNNSGPARLLRNDVADGATWLGARLLRAGRVDHGALLRVTVDGRQRLRRAHTDGGYAAANDPRILVGAGAGAGKISKIRVVWSDGAVEDFPPGALVVGAYRDLLRGEGTPQGGDAAGSPD